MKFKNQAKLIKSVRLKAGLSQSQMAKLLGYKSGQFISNMERGICGLPPESHKKIRGLVSKQALLSAVIQDVKAHWSEYL
ncbi:XRE family transcriptional regulator [Candidatus Dependentiae bacterium]|nr:MAG: XRE family transcriptional regulator [Candidatus Dependentiae bacterium]